MSQPNQSKAAALFRSIRVMVVEDNSVDREILRSQLEKMGFESIQEARNGSDAIFKIENTGKTMNAFHLIITDWRMPERDGLSLVKYLKGEKSLRATRIVMLTSVADVKNVKVALRAGIDDFVIKPIDYEVLSRKLEGLLRRSADQEEE